jgi:mono/diheme cytochrome c family protein
LPQLRLIRLAGYLDPSLGTYSPTAREWGFHVTGLHRTLILPLVLTAASALPAAAAQPAAAPAVHGGVAGKSWALVEEYCSECHNAVDWAGSVAFDTMSPDEVTTEPRVWEAAIRKLQGRLMPPPGKKQPSQAAIDDVVTWLQTTLDDAAAKAPPRGGFVAVQRLNRDEYQNVVRDLLGVEIKAADLLPPENEVDGFANVAAALSVSPYFMDQYIAAARTVARIAVGDPAPKVTNSFYPVPADVSQEGYIPGFPLGTRGGMKFRHNFPANGEYRFNINDLDVGLYPSAAFHKNTLVVLIDGAEVFRQSLGGPEDLALVDREGADGRRKLMSRFQNIPVTLNAGTHEIVVTFIERALAQSDEVVGGAGGFGGGFGRLNVPRMLDGVQILGPSGAISLAHTESRDKIFICTPKAAAEERACAEQIALSLAGRAYRRPVDASDVSRLMPFYQLGRQNNGSFDDGVRYLVTAVLSSPDFLYRAVAPPKDADRYRPLSDLELATRLSFFLWSQGPDESLMKVALSGKLHDPEQLKAQTARMMADPRGAALVDGFAMRWFNLDELESVMPDPKLFPEFSVALREDFTQELVLFLKSVMLSDQSVMRLIDADYTFLNERLARHYGITDVFGPQFRRVQLKDNHRFGMLGKGAMLLRTSYGDRTSPILRGAWVLDKLMGTPPAPPPPGVNTDISTPVGQKPKTLRARLEKHRANQSCRQCHGVIDPIGLSLDSFDAIGRWRDFDTVAQENIDPDTVLANGVRANGVNGLREEIMRQPEKFVLSMTRKLAIYAIGRELDPQDMPTVRGIIRTAKAQDYTFASLVQGIVASPAFRLQARPKEDVPVQTKVAAAQK